MDEFKTINTYFKKLTEGRDEALALKDDAACLNIPEDCTLVVTSDTLNVGTHIFETASPQNIAHKALRTNLSDLAAMGAQPYAYQLCISFPNKPTQNWLSAFTSALLEDQKKYGIFCSGGDTTGTYGPLSVSITAFGLVKKGQALMRNGAKKNDSIFITAPIGESYIGYKILNGDLNIETSEPFIDRYHKPQPRLDIVHKIREHINSAIDISDGLIADIGHIACALNLDAHIKINDNLFTKQTNTLIETGQVDIKNLITGGEDYEIAFSAPPQSTAFLEQHYPDLIKIGHFTAGTGQIHIKDKDEQPIHLKQKGWTHF